MTVKTTDFDFPLDPELIAQEPAEQRDRSRLMKLNRKKGRVEHRIFADLPEFLRDGDLLVMNNTRVIPARFACRRKTGAKLEGLFCLQHDDGAWEVLLKNARRCRPGEWLQLLRTEYELNLLENLGKGRWRVTPNPQAPPQRVLDQAGEAPLPPYIRRKDPDTPQVKQDLQRYQTVYAERSGAVAAPTAGLHFTPELLDALKRRGVQQTSVTLHVGLGTFRPIETEDPKAHKMHAEWYEMSKETASLLNAARRENRRIVAVGTTSVRVLETIARDRSENGAPGDGLFAAGTGWTDIFIYPPATIRAVDALITNFHLPKSTLLMLVSALCAPGSTDGIEMILSAYRQAVEKRYRFFSYGDAMLIE